MGKVVNLAEIYKPILHLKTAFFKTPLHSLEFSQKQSGSRIFDETPCKWPKKLYDSTPLVNLDLF